LKIVESCHAIDSRNRSHSAERAAGQRQETIDESPIWALPF